MASENWNKLWTSLKNYIDAGLQAAKDYADEHGGGGGGTPTPTYHTYGLEWDVTNATFTRLDEAAGLNGGANFNTLAPWSGMKRCNLTDAGVVSAYYGDPNFKNDGSTGQVMVEIPKFYYKTVPVSYDVVSGQIKLKKVQYYVSDGPAPGYRVHPAFVRNGEELDYIYIGAYEAVVYDTSESKYKADFAFAAAEDKLSSVAGYKPVSGKNATFTRAIGRQMAHNRGDGWEQQDFLTISAVQMLMLIEYGTFDMQTAIGAGVSTKTDDGNTNMAENTGYTANLGNASGSANTAASGQLAVSYRGIENLWGNIWGWVDGINVIDFFAYIADHGFADDISTAPYKKINAKLAQSSGYCDNLIYDGTESYAMLPYSAGGSSNAPVYDYCYAASGARVVVLGGGWYYAAGCGGWCWGCNSASSNSNRDVGSRLGFYKRTTRPQAA